MAALLAAIFLNRQPPGVVDCPVWSCFMVKLGMGCAAFGDAGFPAFSAAQ